MSDVNVELGVGGVDVFLDDGLDLEFYPELMNLLEETEPPPPSPESEEAVILNPSPVSEPVPSWIGEVENILMNDDDDDVIDGGRGYYDEFLSDILLDAPASDRSGSESSPQSDVSDFNVGSETVKEMEAVNAEVEKSDDDDVADDPDSKKRKRQLRNKDAALRSRERKKMYVKDLEIKSRYLEDECRRLGRLLQCCYAENHDLRFRLFQMGNGANGASMTKQESAVLLLESLLLGSLFWFLGIMCLFHLPKLPRSDRGAVSLQGIEKSDPRSAHLRRAANKLHESPNLGTLLNSRRCKALRTRMKPLYAAAVTSSCILSVA